MADRPVRPDAAPLMFAALLVNFLFWTGISIGAVALVALVDVSGGEWLGPLRAVAIRFSRFLPISFVLLVVLVWRRPTAVLLRDLIAAAVVYVCAFAHCRRPTGSSAVTFLIVYAAGFSLLAVDLIMSLEPHWTSTLFPAYVFTGNVYAGTAAAAVWMARTVRNGDVVGRWPIRDAANLLVGLALFWMYLFWSQFLVIWYGNVTAQVGFLMTRVGTTRASAWIVLVCCWALPTIVFVPQRGKRAGALRGVGIVMLIGFWFERWILVAPDLLPPSAVAISVAVTGIVAAAFVVSVGGGPLSSGSSTGSAWSLHHQG